MREREQREGESKWRDKPEREQKEGESKREKPEREAMRERKRQ